MHARCSRRRSTLTLVALSLSGCSYNRLVSLREAIDGAWAQVENQLQRRNDLIPNLIEVTKGYAAHEKEIFEAVANARAQMLAAGRLARGDDRRVGRGVVGAVAPAGARRELSQPESRRAVRAPLRTSSPAPRTASRPNGGATTRSSRSTTRSPRRFPAVITAKALGFGEQKYFEAPESAKQVPQVKF